MTVAEDQHGSCNVNSQAAGCIGRSEEGDVLVFPAASSPSMRRRISLDPKILPMILETCPPMLWNCCGAGAPDQATRAESNGSVRSQVSDVCFRIAAVLEGRIFVRGSGGRPIRRME